jgi:peptide/nickel transport system permease protein
MLSFLGRRLLAVIPVLLVVSVVVFLLLRLSPGDPAAVIAGNNATSEDIANIRQQLGLDSNLATQYGIWMGRVLQGDLGYSYYLGKPVLALIAQRVEPTLSLALGTALLAVLIAVPLGTLAAWRMGGWLDRSLSAFSVAGFSVPVFVIAYVLIYVFAMQLQWLPVQGYKPLTGPQAQGVWDWARQLVLPWLTLSTIYVALIARITRASVSEALSEDYIRTARAKGLAERLVIWKHALRNALMPVVTIAGLQFGNLISGAVLVETVFSWPGLGTLAFDSILGRDYPTLLGVLFFSSVLVIVANQLTDLAYRWIDPRLRGR